MAKLVLHDLSLSPEAIQQEREQRFLKLSAQEKLEELFALINLSIAMNGGKPIKEPQGKGLIIRKKK